VENQEPIIIVKPSGEVVVGVGYSIGQVLDAIEAARRAVLGVVLRPAEQQEAA
jgi:hypothetical protein